MNRRTVHAIVAVAIGIGPVAAKRLLRVAPVMRIAPFGITPIRRRLFESAKCFKMNHLGCGRIRRTQVRLVVQLYAERRAQQFTGLGETAEKNSPFIPAAGR